MSEQVKRKRSCECGKCQKCRNLVASRQWYFRNREEVLKKKKQWWRGMTLEERQEWRVERLDSLRRNQSNWERRHPDKIREKDKKYAEKYPERIKAHNTTNYAIRANQLERGECEQAALGECRGGIHAHHDDYGKPLEVRWLCMEHHMQHHAEASW